MHEYSIVQALMDRIEAEAAAHHARAVHRVVVRIGEAAGIEVELLRTAYEMVCEGTICGDAPLEITTVVQKWECSACGAPVAAGGWRTCTACGKPARLVEGDEILLERLELEVG